MKGCILLKNIVQFSVLILITKKGLSCSKIGAMTLPRIFEFYLNLLIGTTDKVIQDFNDIFRVSKITSSFIQLKF